jgi:hypothetical protein
MLTLNGVQILLSSHCTSTQVALQGQGSAYATGTEQYISVDHYLSWCACILLKRKPLLNDNEEIDSSVLNVALWLNVPGITADSQ